MVLYNKFSMNSMFCYTLEYFCILIIDRIMLVVEIYVCKKETLIKMVKNVN